MSREPIQRQVKLSNKAFCFFDWTGDSESTVLLLHATGFHARCWDQTVLALPPEAQVLALDMRGHGRSTKEGPFAWSDFDKDVVAFVDELDLTRVLVVGHSMGGHCALYAAAQRPNRIKSLVLVDPVTLSPDDYINRKSAEEMSTGEHPVAKRRNQWQSPDEMFESFKERHPFSLWQPKVLLDYCEYGLLKVEEGYQLACPPSIEAAVYTGTPYAEITHLFSRILQPTVVMRAKQRTETSARLDFSNSPTWQLLASQLQNGRDMHLQELSHFIPMERPDLVAMEISACLDAD